VTTQFLKNGEILRVSEDGQTSEIVKDGQGVRIPMILMDHATVKNDGALHRPGHRTTDAKVSDARHVAYAGMVHDVSTAWQRPGETVETTTDKKPAADARERAYETMIAGLNDAWRAA
jgi:hypothetical protein